MKTENKKKSQKEIQIKGKMPLSVHFFRDAEADALNMERCQLDKATLIKDAQKRMKNYYDDSSLPEDVSLAAEVPEEYGAPRRSGPSSSPPSSARRKPRQ